MRNILLILFALSMGTAFSQGQFKLVKGTLRDSEGNGLPGVSVLVKGTTNGVVTDLDGNYEIRVRVGETLVFAFVGMETRELLITGDYPGEEPTTTVQEPNHTFNFSTESDEDQHPGIKVIRDKAQQHNGENLGGYRGLRTILRVGGRYIVIENFDRNLSTSTKVLFTTKHERISTPNLLPRQTTYSQGLSSNGNLIWQGPDSNVPLSWGPPIDNLEYDGSPYTYDTNGRLVSLGAGNGNKAKRYNSPEFLHTGYKTENSLKLQFPLFSRTHLTASYTNNWERGVMRGSENSSHFLNLTIAPFQLSNTFNISGDVIFRNSRATRPNMFGSFSRVLQSWLVSPVTFDPFNGFGKKAFNTSGAYLLNDLSKRSFSPDLFDNPVGILAESTDQITASTLMSLLKVQYDLNEDWQVHVGQGIEFNHEIMDFGYAPGTFIHNSGIFTSRNYQFKRHFTDVEVVYDHDFDDLSIQAKATGNYNYTGIDVNRKTGTEYNYLTFPSLPLAGIRTDTNILTNRIILESRQALRWRYKNWVGGVASNSFYTSSTVKKNSLGNPVINLFVDLGSIFNDNYFYSPLDEIRISGGLSKTVKETDLITNDFSYQSDQYSATNFRSFFPGQEVFLNNSLELIEVTQEELELEISSYIGNWQLGFIGTRRKLGYSNYVYPVKALNTGNYSFINVGSFETSGWEVSLSAHYGVWNAHWNSAINWSNYQSIAKSVNDAEYYQIGGIDGVERRIQEGYPLGAIFGSYWLKNDEGEQIIGMDGYPLQSSDLSYLGNPQPQGVINWVNSFTLEGFSLNMTLHYEYGASIWNGTQAIMEYYGTAESTSSARNRTNYIFPGVNELGSINTVPVSLFDNGLPTTENYWMRYGTGGVTEEHMQEIRWLSMRHIGVQYEHMFQTVKNIHSLSYELFARNILLGSNYSGMDPRSQFLNSGFGSGVDLFNMPVQSSFGLGVTIKL